MTSLSCCARPLPMTLLSSISFRTSAHRQAFESAAGDVSNVDLSPHRLEVAEALYAADTEGNVATGAAARAIA